MPAGRKPQTIKNLPPYDWGRGQFMEPKPAASTSQPRRSPPLPDQTSTRLFDTDTPRNRAAAKRYGTGDPAMLAGAVGLSDRMKQRNPAEIRRDQYGSIDSDIDLPAAKPTSRPVTRKLSRGRR